MPARAPSRFGSNEAASERYRTVLAAAVGRSEDAVDDVDPKINHRQAMWSADVDVSIDPDSPRKTPYSHSITT
jgi:hypothetical protein